MKNTIFGFRGRESGRLAVQPARGRTLILALAMVLSAGATVTAAGNNGFYTVTPCRVADTRNAAGPYGGPALNANTSRSFTVTGQCGIPSTAEAIALNVTVTDATAPGDLRLYPTGYAQPSTTGINYLAGKTRANNGSYALGTNGGLTMHCDQASGTVNVILDVFGYFETVAAPPPPTPTPTPTPPPSGGGVHAWSTHFGGTLTSDAATAVGIAVDSAGAAVVLGQLAGRADFGGGFLTSAGSTDIYLVKYAANGSYVWSQRFGGTGTEKPKGIAVDAGNNIVITGYFGGTVSFGGTALAGGSASGFLAKYSPSGTHLWSRRLTTSPNGVDEGRAVAVDGAGNVIVGAGFNFSTDFGAGSWTSAGGADMVLAKYSSAGAYTWAKRIGGASDDFVQSVAVDTTTGEIAMTGYFAGSLNLGGGSTTSAGLNDAFIAKYSSTGAHVWSGRWGSTGEDKGAGVAIDALGSVAVTGLFTNNVDFGGGPLTNTGGNTSGDIFLVKLSATGVHLWSKGFGTAMAVNEMGNAVAFDDSGNVLLTGSLVALTAPYTMDFGGGAITGDGWYNVFLAKFSSTGSHVWSKRFLGGGANADGRAIAADSSGNVFCAGTYEGSINFGGSTLTSPGGTDSFLLKLGP